MAVLADQRPAGGRLTIDGIPNRPDLPKGNAMNAAGHSLGFLRELSWGDVLLVLGVLVGGQLLVLAVRWIVRRAAESAPSHRRLVILRTAPIARLLIGVAGIAIIVPILVEPTF